MNHAQVAFVASIALPFVVLVVLQRALSSSLNAAGIHFSDLILIGLPKDVNNPEMGSHTFEELVVSTKAYLHAFDVPGVGTVDVLSPPFIGTLAVLLAAFVWTTLFQKSRPKVLDPTKWQTFPLTQKTQISPNTAIYRFTLPTSTSILGLPTGQHIQVSAEINGKDVMRSYTPTSSDDDMGHFDLLIKSYEKGNISRLFSLLKIGDTIKVKGPKGQFNYTPDLTDSIGMIAGGTGITPMIQIIRAALKNPLDNTRLSLIYANVNEEDILLKKELDTLVDTHGANGRFKVHYVLNNPPTGWTGGVGFVSKDMIKEHLPEAGIPSKILMCGPPPMVSAMKKHLDELKFPQPRAVSKLVDQVFVF
ncbi:ferredoxin reductase-like C-terminal NADP-linked domain-containing protein [Hymenopellis radicata]|nr:ferredoxin reductase-like C-terminal NADP-linked domain-containing protein [Hymenopellis radicata]